MRGEVLKPDDASGTGLILGEDGKRYHFTTARVHKGASLAAGDDVDFIGLGEEARDIYVLAAKTRDPVVHTLNDPPVRAYASAAPAKSDGMFKYFLRALSRNYFRFNGRARRSEYWGFVLFQILTLMLLLVLDSFVTALVYETTDPESLEFLPIFSGIFYVYSLIPAMALAIRRLHDRDLSGWLYLINIIPYIGGIVLFILMCLDSRREPNKHGPSPKYGGIQTADVFN